MTAESETAAARASQEATDWFLMLQEDPDDAELRDRFEAWLAADPQNEVAWTITQRTTGIMARVPPAHSDARFSPSRIGETRENIGTPTSGPFAVGRDRRAYVRRLRVVSAVAVAACLGFLFLPGLLLQLQADYVTSTAEVRTVQLEDGSTLILAAGSAVEIAFGGAERRVNLLAGEAFFTVRHDDARPFRVAANGVETTDLGTAFMVGRTEVGATISVETGSVRVDYVTASPSVSEMLEAGQTIRVAWTGTAVRGEQPPVQVAAWRQKRLIAQDQPMQDVINQLRPYFDGKIILMDGALADRRVTGVYNLADPANALRGIVQARGAVVQQITPWVLIVSSK